MSDNSWIWVTVGIALMGSVPACLGALWLARSPMPKRLAKAVYWAIFDKQQFDVPAREMEHRGNALQSIHRQVPMSAPVERVSAQPWWSPKSRPVLIVCLCIIYIISPIDLMPEAFLGPFGLVDDFGALFVAVNTIRKALQSFGR